MVVYADLMIRSGWTDPILWPPDVKNWLTRKDPDAGKDWRWEGKGTTEDEMVGWHHWLNGREFEQALEVGDRQGSLVCCSSWGHKESDKTEWLNWWTDWGDAMEVFSLKVLPLVLHILCSSASCLVISGSLLKLTVLKRCPWPTMLPCLDSRANQNKLLSRSHGKWYWNKVHFKCFWNHMVVFKDIFPRHGYVRFGGLFEITIFQISSVYLFLKCL